MAYYIKGRESILQALKEELVGPSPQGEEIDVNRVIKFDNVKQSYGPWKQKESHEEILNRDAPHKRYGVGVLYPREIPIEETDKRLGGEIETDINDVEEGTLDIVTASGQESITKIEEREERASIPKSETQDYDFDLSLTNTFRPSSMGVSFLAKIPPDGVLVVDAHGGRYKKHEVLVEGKERLWWLRSSVSIRAKFDASTIHSSRKAKILPSSVEENNTDGLDIAIEVFSRSFQNNQKQLITVCLVNNKQVGAQVDQNSLFQSSFKVFIISSHKRRCIYPYPGLSNDTIDGLTQNSSMIDEEQQSLALLYRKAKTFAVGHGCAADWESVAGTWQSQLLDNDAESKVPQDEEGERISWIRAECLPTVEVPSITADVMHKDGSTIEVSMAPLAGLVPGNNGFNALSEVISAYEDWIVQKNQEISLLAPQYLESAQRHMEECTRCAKRMRTGLKYLQENPVALRAFQLANHAILLQQIRSGQEPRKTEFDTKKLRYAFSREYVDFDVLKPEKGRGKWRAFQIAFILMTIQSTVEDADIDRETVELIWFPTGGGKTEAYFGLSAFAIFMRRLEDKQDIGVHILMRYTLRLLTAQQFQRASGLLCAMEYLRRKNVSELGSHEFSIGIWLGGSTTPNTRKDAIANLNRLKKNDRHADNMFIISRCPWCQAQIGPAASLKKSSQMDNAPGYQQQNGTVVFKCLDSRCEFTSGLPVYVIDEDIYDKRPSMLIGTVDKFAMLAWKPDIRSIFGINQEGKRVCSPPSLIIQDELHLISGPLGSLVGLYEAVIEELCTDRRGNKAVSPKIVSSTATISRYNEQIKRLYARPNVTLFPPPGLDADDSFFSRYARNSDGKLAHGRIYVGVHAPGLGSLQTTQVRTFTALLQASVSLPVQERDPWWTLLLFFNSLRELGTTLSLFQSDIPDYFRVLMNRMGLDFSQVRKFWNILELTSRLRNEEVPQAITKLEVKCEREDQKEHPIDVCLASSIIEVGIDIDRLSLMTVVGQPKTTAQYIQVTGRVGRRWWERPGLVVTLYGASKPRDRSHFEKFRSYHERLYAEVEPTSVTPFSPPVLDRALHAIMVSYVRQLGTQDAAQSPYPYPTKLIEQLRQIVLPRVKVIDVDELQNFGRVFEKRSKEWQQWNRSVWEDHSGDNIALLRYASEYANSEQVQLSWPTATSMRDVDAQCEAVISNLYDMQGNI